MSYITRQRPFIKLLSIAMAVSSLSSGAWADAFTDYTLQGSFTLPASAGGFDLLADGRIVTVSGSEVYVETGPGTHTFNLTASLAGMDVPGFGLAFVKVSPDGSRLAVGNGGGASFGNYQVGVFDTTSFTGDWFQANHFEAAWYDNQRLAVTAGDFTNPSTVTMLDTNSANPASPINPVLIDGIGGSSAGIAFDSQGNLYTGNGFSFIGPSPTGTLKAFDQADWDSALTSGSALDFENGGTLIADLLSAGSLGFDAEGNLHVGGGDFGSGDSDYVGLIHSTGVADALSGNGAINQADPNELRTFDPDNINSNFYDVLYDDTLDLLYIRDQGAVYVYAVPEPTGLALSALGCLMVPFRRRRR